MIKLNSQQKGFTLIELLIYISIFSIIVGAVVGLAVLVSSQKVNSQITADVNYQGEAVMALMTQTVHQSTSVTSPSPGTSSSSLILSMPTTAANPTVFSAYNDGTTSRLQIQEGSPIVQSKLTNARVTVSGLTFTNQTITGTTGSILIKFTLTYRTNSQRSEFSYFKTFHGAATIP